MVKIYHKTAEIERIGLRNISNRYIFVVGNFFNQRKPNESSVK